MPFNDIEMQALLRVAKDKQASQAYDEMHRIIIRYVEKIAEADMPEKDAMAYMEQLQNQINDVKEEQFVNFENKNNLTVPRPAPRPEPKAQAHINDARENKSPEQKNLHIKRAALILTASALPRPEPKTRKQAIEQLRQLRQQIGNAIANNQPDEAAKVATQYFENLNDFINKVVDNQNNYMGITKLGPTTAVILHGELHGELSGAIPDIKNELYDNPRTEYYLAGKIDDLFDEFARDKLNDDEYNRYQDMLRDAGLKAEAPEADMGRKFNPRPLPPGSPKQDDEG